MKKLLALLFLPLLFTSCDSPKKALSRGAYEQACMMAVKKLQKNPNDTENAEIFTVAYQKANQADIDRIDYLKLSGDQHSWDEIYQIYNRLDRRQKLAETVLPIRAGGKTIDFEHINYNQMLIEAKNSAADFHYNKGTELLKGDKLQARQAYDHLIQVRNYSNEYSDLESKIQEARDKSTTYVFLTPLNKTYAQLSPEFLSSLVNFGMNEIDETWTRFYNTPTREYFDYTVYVTISSVYVGPDDVKESKETINKKVEDGWLYEYDSKGNVKKDSLGNDIKKQKYKNISCTITKRIQKKTSVLKAIVEIQDNKARKIVSSTPTEVQYNFEYVSSFANGDLNALDEETRKSVGKSPVAFPNDLDMIQYSGDKIRYKVIEIIKSNRGYFK
ncbi:MAG: hypothetical protein U0W24_14805 [Bacteroidales bacterium]